MKLRVRSIETKETLRVSVPDPCSLHHLKQTLAPSISSVAVASPSSIRLSLNRCDELHAPFPNDSLHSLGLTSGDLLYYTLDPSPQALAPPPPPLQSPNQIAPQSSNFSNPEALIGGDSGMDASNSETLAASGTEWMEISQSVVQSPNQFVAQGSVFSNPKFQMGENSSMGDSIDEEERLGVTNSETLGASGAESMELDGGCDGIGWKNYSAPFLLRRELREEVGENCSNHKLLVIAVHAVMLESGFVRLCTPSTGFTMPISYTLPEIVKNGGGNGNGVDGVVLKCQSLGKFVNVYGSLANGGSGVYGVCLDEQRFAPGIEFVLANGNANVRDGLLAEREVSEFWKIVKDGITLPLLIDLCAKAGLPAPPSFMRLPLELKMKILEPLPGVDIAKVGSVCKELRNLANNDELWKQKYAEEFGSSNGGEGTMMNWKYRFVRNWETKQQQSKALVLWSSSEMPYNSRIRRDPNPFFVPPVTGIIGGDYDRFPVFGQQAHPFGQPHPFGQQPRILRRSFSPNCNLGGFSG